MDRVAIVTGGNRGIGFEVCRGLLKAGIKVVLAARNRDAGEAAVAKLSAELSSGKESKSQVVWLPFDANDLSSAERLVAQTIHTFGRIDILVNNAGVLIDPTGDGPRIAPAQDVDVAKLPATFAVNTIAPFRLCQLVLPSMQEKGYGRIVNVSSGMGQLSEMNGGWPAYRLSKTALNAVTRIFAFEMAQTPQTRDVLINSCCPGWVRTAMGGSSAPRSVEQGADTIVWLATLPAGGPNGGFFRDRKPMAW